MTLSFTRGALHRQFHSSGVVWSLVLSRSSNGCVPTDCGSTPRKQTSCGAQPLDSVGWLHWYGVVCWALLQPILLSSAAPHKVHGALAPSVQPIEVFSVCHLHAPPPGRS